MAPDPAPRRRAKPTSTPYANDGEDLDGWRTYDSVADTYARVLAPRMAVPAGELVELVGIPPGARVLDVGTGTGVTARAAALAAGDGAVVVGIDPSLPMLRNASAVAGGPRYAAAEAIDLPFRDGSFGYVLSTFVLSHFTRYETALFDMMRVLASGGRMGAASWGESEDEFIRTWNGVAEEFAEHEILQDARTRAMPQLDHFADPDRLRDTLHQAGLREIRVERREYRFQTTIEDYLAGREAVASGRFLKEMLGPELWESFRRRVLEVFRQRFPGRFNDFRDAILAVGIKP